MMDYKLYYKHRQEYFNKFNQAYARFMTAIAGATTKYSARLPVDSNEYENAISHASLQFIKELGDLKGKYADVSEVDRSLRGYK